jgi:hypothetical protein
MFIISDGINNGKGSIDIFPYEKNFYIYNLEIINNNIYVFNQKIDFNEIKFILFNFNDDLLTFYRDKKLKKKFKSIDRMINFFFNIEDILLNYENITLFNKPSTCFKLYDKITIYDTINKINNKIIKIPKYKQIECLEDLKDISFFPCIIKQSNSSHSLGDTLVYNLKELIQVYNRIFFNKKYIMCVEYIDSYIDCLKTNHSLRFIILGNKIIDYYFRPSNKWNIHNNDQIDDKIIEADKYFKNIFDDNIKYYLQKYIDNLNDIYGYCSFAIDAIFNDNSIYICEIGLKNYDYTQLKKTNYKLKKLSLSKEEYFKFIKNNIFCSYTKTNY